MILTLGDIKKVGIANKAFIIFNQSSVGTCEVCSRVYIMEVLFLLDKKFFLSHFGIKLFNTLETVRDFIYFFLLIWYFLNLSHL